MQLSIKTPHELTLPLLEKCAVLAERAPSHVTGILVWQCLKWMDMPHRPFQPLELVRHYYGVSGREMELLSREDKAQDILMERLIVQNREKRAAEAASRLADFKDSLKREPPPKHLHIKISQGTDDLPQRIKAKAAWLRITLTRLWSLVSATAWKRWTIRRKHCFPRALLTSSGPPPMPSTAANQPMLLTP